MRMTAPHPQTPVIFVLEDEPDIARLICASLTEYGFRCEHLRTGREFLARAHSASPDLCIVDLGLPDMDGMQVVRDSTVRAAQEAARQAKDAAQAADRYAHDEPWRVAGAALAVGAVVGFLLSRR